MAINESNIVESPYTYEESFLKLAAQFFDIDSLSTAKAGMFGYVTEVMAHIAKDSVFQRNALYNEYFLNTAQLDTSLYNWSKILDEHITFATPARIETIFRINLQELVLNSKQTTLNGDYLQFVIDKDVKFYASKFSYMLPAELIVNIQLKNNTISALEVLFNKNNYNYMTYEVENNPYLKNFINTSNNVTFLNIRVPIYQIERKENSYTITSEDILDRNVIEVRYVSNLVSFNVFHKPNYSTLSGFKRINTVFNELNDSPTVNSAFYSIIDGSILRIYFSNKAGFFRPFLSDVIKIETFTTLGDEGNFKYGGTISYIDETLKNIKLSIVPATDSHGGSHSNTFIKSKMNLINKLRTRDNYITEYDINNLFERLKFQLNITDSSVTTIKHRDDLLERYFTTYALIKTTNGVVIPTNTIDLDLTINDISVTSYVFKPGTIIIYDRFIDSYRLLNETEYPEMYINSLDHYIYCIPYLINFDFNIFPKINVYNTNYSKTLLLKYDIINLDVVNSALINSYNIERNSLLNSNSYKVTCQLNTTLQNYSSIKIRVFLMQYNLPIGFADMIQLTGTNTYKLDILTNDEFTLDGKYIIVNTFYNLATENIIEELPIYSDYKLLFTVLFDDESTQYTLGLDKLKLPMLRSIPSLESSNYTFLSSFTSNEYLQFAESYNDMIHIKLKVDQNTGRIKLESLPLIGASFFLNSVYNKKFSNEVDKMISTVRQMVDKLENNTSLDLKFYNSYGISKYFTSEVLDITLKLQIKLKVPYTPEFTSLVKSYIVTFIEKANINKIDKRFSVSNLIASLESTFNDIAYIKFVNMNNSNIQSIEDIPLDKSKPVPLKYVPEFLTVRKKPVADPLIGEDFTYDINIEYL
jgi:hypothetical protein